MEPSQSPNDTPLSTLGGEGSTFEQHDAVRVHPPDRGVHAYAYLFGAFVIEFLAWSLPFSYGVFLNYYTSQSAAGFGDTRLAPVIGTLSTGVMYLAYPVVLRATTMYPHYCRTYMAAGLALCVAGLVGAAFAKHDWELLLSQGIAYSIGGSLLSFPSVAFLFEWFPERRGLAMGILFSGTGIGGIVMPFAIDAMLRNTGQRTTFLILASLFAATMLPCFVFIKPRLPPISLRRERFVDVSFFANLTFWPLFVCSTLQGLANFVPGIYLPSYSTDIGLSNAAATLVVSIINGASVPGAIIIGWATDRYDLGKTIMLSTIGAAISVFLLWGFAKGLVHLIMFALIYGFCAGGFSAMWPRFASAVAKDDIRLATTVYSVFGASRGVGNILAGPISSALLSHGGHLRYGASNYGPLILFTGVTMLASACGSFFGAFGRGGVRIAA